MQFLQQAERHIADGERHIAGQERRVAELRREGCDASRARSLLALFRDMQVQHVAHRDMLLKALRQ